MNSVVLPWIVQVLPEAIDPQIKLGKNFETNALPTLTTAGDLGSSFAAFNPSGGLIGLGHPVGATGVRMVLDCARQVTGRAGGYQLQKAENMITFNVGGSTTTCASFVVGVGP